MKVKITDANKYKFMASVKYPAEVEAEKNNDNSVLVSSQELLRIGAKKCMDLSDPSFLYEFTSYTA